MRDDSIINIRINSGTIIKTILFVVFLFLLYSIRDIVLVVLTAIVIASAVEPATKWFTKHNVHRVAAVLVVYLVATIILAGVFYLLVPSVLNEASNFLTKAPEYLNKIKLWSPIEPSQSLVATQSLSTFSSGFSFEQIVGDIQSMLSNTSEGFVKIVSLVFGGAFSFILIVVLSFYLAVQEDGVSNFLKVITPLKSQKYVVGLWVRTRDKIGYWMQGQLLLSVIIAILVYLGLTIIGVKNALLLALLAGIFELIPVFGPILAAIPAILAGIFDGGGLTTGLLIAGLYLIVQQFENHLIYPLVVQKIVGISPIIVILALIIGGKLAGFLGIILAVPFAAALMEYFHDIQREKFTAMEKMAAEPQN
ncbi:MAG: AI-2E family transporter [Candidatus Paceibacterota bacterium]|jgi:predicted PurR-regulated permease PerM